MNKKQPRVPRTGIGMDVPIIGDSPVPKAVHDLIISCFNEYVTPAFVDFNVLIATIMKKIEKLENDRRFTIDLSDDVKEILCQFLPITLGSESSGKVIFTPTKKEKK